MGIYAATGIGGARDALANPFGGGDGGGSGDYTVGVGNSLYLDDDSDTYIQATQDDRMQFYAGGIARMDIFGANVDIANGTNLRPATSGGSDLGALARQWGDAYIDQAGAIYLDDDGDSYISCDADDSMIFVTGGFTRLDLGAGTATFSAAVRPVSDGAHALGDEFRGWGGLNLSVLGSEPATPTTAPVVYCYDNASSEEIRIKFTNGTVKTIATDV